MDFVETIERQELIQKLIDRGYGSMVEALLTHENEAWTKKGRPNKCGMCRVLGYKPKQLEDALAKCREILEADLRVG
jgi:hypothetical protein